MHYTNILCHTTDVLHQLAVRNTAPAIADRELIEDTLFVAKRTSNNMMGSQVSTNLNHVIYERHLALNRDDRKEVLQLYKSKQAKAHLAPYDSDDFLFGSERDVQEQDIKDKREDNKQVVHTSAPKQQQQTKKPFQSKPVKKLQTSSNGSGVGGQKSQQEGGNGNSKKQRYKSTNPPAST